VTSAYQQTVAEYGVPFIVSGASSPIITHRTDVNTSTVFHHCPTTDAYGQYTTMFIDQVMRPAINTKFGYYMKIMLSMLLFLLIIILLPDIAIIYTYRNLWICRVTPQFRGYILAHI
jgi:hypothetical protein